MNEEQLRARLQDLDRPATPSPEFSDRLLVMVDAGLAGKPMQRPTSTTDFGRARWWPIALVAVLLAIVAAIAVGDDGARVGDTLLTEDLDAPAGQPPAPDGEGDGGDLRGPASHRTAGTDDRAKPVEAIPGLSPERAGTDYGGAERAEPSAQSTVRIASIGRQDGGFRWFGLLYIWDPDGLPRHVDVGPVGPPSWAPDGLALVTETEDGIMKIFRPDGTVVRTLGPGIMPQWSPDGRHIVFGRGCDDLADCNIKMFVIGADGSGERSLGSGGYATWMPDGRSVLYSDVGTGVCDWVSHCETPLMVVGIDGKDRRSLGVSGAMARMSPDGRLLAYVDGPPGNGNIYVAQADGRNPVAVADTSADEFWPAWMPNSDSLVYSVNNSIVLVNADGSGARRIGAGRLPAVVLAY